VGGQIGPTPERLLYEQNNNVMSQTIVPHKKVYTRRDFTLLHKTLNENQTNLSSTSFSLVHPSFVTLSIKSACDSIQVHPSPFLGSEISFASDWCDPPFSTTVRLFQQLPSRKTCSYLLFGSASSRKPKLPSRIYLAPWGETRPSFLVVVT
jgi:hypothetical protein